MVPDRLGLLPPGARDAAFDLGAMLQRRGLLPFRLAGRRSLLLPRDPSQIDAYYHRLAHYSFRLVLRDLIAHPGAPAERLTTFCSPATITRHLAFLERLGTVEPWEAGFRLTASVRSFGGTLEWFVAELLRRECAAQTLWGVRVKGRETGGDYDVLAQVEHELVYVEVKASPPKHVDQRDVAAFLSRTADLAPHVAIFFVDTELRMLDKIVPLFEAGLAARSSVSSRVAEPVLRLRDELFHIDRRIFIVNSKRDIAKNFKDCLRAYWRGLLRV